MTHRTFDEQIANFNRVVSSWDINQEYKVALLGMIASLGYEHEKSITPEPHWISVKERLPEKDGDYLVTFEEGYAEDYGFDPIGFAPFEVDCEGFGIWQESFDRQTLGSLGSDWVEIKAIAWMPLPEPYKGVTE